MAAGTYAAGPTDISAGDAYTFGVAGWAAANAH